jgi:hypothetical protein
VSVDIVRETNRRVPKQNYNLAFCPLNSGGVVSGTG